MVELMTDQEIDIRLQAHYLLRQGENYALAGKLGDARTSLLQAWNLSHELMPRYANAAAWHLAWISLQAQCYAEAAEWFERVSAPMADEGFLWDTARQAQVRVCQILAAKPQTAADELPELLSYDHASGDTIEALSINSLGCFQIARAGQVLGQCKSRKAIGLLRYLLLQHNYEASKEQLVETFWPETPPEKGMHSLHVAIKALRQYLAPQTNYIVFNLGNYFIHPQAVLHDDRNRFIECYSSGDRLWAAHQYAAAESVYQQAITHYSGDYYVDNNDCEWALAEQERLLGKYLSCLERVGDLSFQRGAYDQAISLYQRILQRDEYREDIHSQMMQCYQRLGRRRDALLQYQRCALVLKRDLGIDPMAETQAIYQEIIQAI